jgi:tetratricopeptide (TPR) repeat protein
MGLRSFVFACGVSFFFVIPLSPRDGPGTPEDYLKLSRMNLDFMNYDDAIHYLHKAIGDAPRAKGLRTLLAYAHYRQGRLDVALGALSDELKYAPDDGEALILSALIQYEKGNRDSASETCRKYLTVQGNKIKKDLEKSWAENVAEGPNRGLPSFILGLYERSQGRWDTAAEMFRTALRLGYDPLEARIQLVDMALERNDWSGALNLAGETANKGGAEAAEICVLSALAYHKAGEPEPALSYLRMGMELKPFEQFTLKNLSAFHLSRNEHEKALPILRRLTGLYPADFEARLWLEQAENKRTAMEEILLTKDFVEHRPLRYRYVFLEDPALVAKTANDYCLQLIKSGEIAEAAEWVRRFVELYEKSPTLFYNLGQLYNTLNRAEGALRYAWKAVELKDDYPDAYDLIGGALYKIKDFASAIPFYKKAVFLDPKNPLGYYNLGLAYNQAGKLAEAMENWRSAVEKEKAKSARGGAARGGDALKIALDVYVDPISYNALRMMGQAYMRLGQNMTAIQSYEQAIVLKPKGLEAYLELGSVYWSLKERPKAEEYFKKYIELGGDERKITEIRGIR